MWGTYFHLSSGLPCCQMEQEQFLKRKGRQYFKCHILQNTIMIRAFSSEVEGHDSISYPNCVSYVGNF